MGALRALEELVKVMPSVAHLRKNDKIVDVGIAIGVGTSLDMESY